MTLYTDIFLLSIPIFKFILYIEKEAVALRQNLFLTYTAAQLKNHKVQYHNRTENNSVIAEHLKIVTADIIHQKFYGKH